MQGILSYYALKNKMPARSYWQAMLEIFVLWKARRVTTESEWGRDVVRGRNPYARVDIVEYGVQDVFFETEWQPEREKPHAIFVGSITPRKGIQDLVRAFRDPGLSGFHLNVIGGEDGKWSAELKKSAPHNIRWLGRKTTDETAQLMAKAWCLVLPTRADTSPNVVKEARVIGLPIITTREGGQTSYVKEEEDGYFVGCGDVDGMAKRLSSVLGRFSQAQAMGGLGKRRYRDKFLAKHTSESFVQIYRAAVGG
jgi:glycosyltransferase involved in cell wall biosynthesis